LDHKEKKYLDYLKANCPGIPLQDVTFNFLDGTHSDIVIANGSTAFRFSKYDWAVCYLTNAVRAVRLAKKYVELPLPDIIPLEPGVVKYGFIPGKPLSRNKLLLSKSLEQDYLAKQLGTFLVQLHSVPLEEAKNARLESRFADRDRSYWKSRYHELERKLFPYCDNYTRESIQQLFRVPFEKKNFFDYPPCLVHADLVPRHILCKEKSLRINGITGFGSCGIGDPALDTGALLANFGESFVSRVCEYDESIPEQIGRARFYAALRPIIQAENLADKISTRDFSDYRIELMEPGIFPVGKH